MRYLGIDYGKKRIGIAISDEHGKFAFPEAVLPNDHTHVQSIIDLCTKHKTETVILGESKDFKGKDNAIMHGITKLRDILIEKGFLVIFEPEIMSTIQAERLQGKRSDIDSSAAAVILQSYLDRQREKEKIEEETEIRDKYTILDDEDDAIDDE